MDMALAQSFNVKLALLPEGQDPDSYIQAAGANGFNEYIREHKRDVIGFRMEIGMKEAEHDPVKKSKLVNEIAESISRINKAEDFALQDYYIKQSAELLKVDEAGMVNLVNKFIRERIDQDRRQSQHGTQQDQEQANSAPQTPQEAEQVTTDEAQEWQLIRVLLQYGEKPAEGFTHVAQMIYERIDPEMIETPEVLVFYNTYYAYVTEHQSLPALSYFTLHAAERIQVRTASLLQQKNEVSHNWLEVYGIGMLNGDENYVNDVESTLSYFELKKVKAMQADIRKELAGAREENRLMELMQQFMALKKTEQEILQRPGTVIVKSIGR
jgi:DNA primase